MKFGYFKLANVAKSYFDNDIKYVENLHISLNKVNLNSKDCHGNNIFFSGM
jgi:hypothetical protein